jgi:hypothetical protein
MSQDVQGFELDPRIKPNTFGGLAGPFYSRRRGDDRSAYASRTSLQCAAPRRAARLADIALSYARARRQQGQAKTQLS